jgi:NAD(P)H dehydrogenase (quinone)
MSKLRILVTGATGKTGKPTTLELIKMGFKVRALVRQDDHRAEKLWTAGAEICLGSLEDYRDLERAMQGIGRAYFCPPLAPGTLRRAALFATAAREAKLEAIVQLSQWIADPIHPSIHAREKWLTSQIFSSFRDLGVITVQPGWFADNYFAGIGQIAQFGLLALPLGRGTNAPPSNEDIARVIAACLANPDAHIGKAYRPTGPRLLDPSEIAHIMGKVLGRPVRYRDVPLPMFMKAASSLGIPPFVISQLHWFLQDYQRDSFGVGAPTSVVEDVTGSAPEDFMTIARRYVEGSRRAERDLAGLLREASGMIAALLARAPNLRIIEEQYGIPDTANFLLASESSFWKSTHASREDTSSGLEK